MPIHCCTVIPRGVDALWTYIPGELINFRRYRNIRSLQIECYQFSGPQPPRILSDLCTINWEDTIPSDTNVSSLCSQCSGRMDKLSKTEREEAIALLATQGPYTLPSLQNLFPNLEILTITNDYIKEIPVFIGELTDLPNKLITLSISKTHIQNIGEMIQSCVNLRLIKLVGNVYPINMIRGPPKLYRFHIYAERFVHQLPVSEILRQLICKNTSLPEGIANVDPNITTNILMSGCIDHPYDNAIIEDLDLQTPRYNHINRINADRICLQFGSIPRRIRLTHEDDRFNPIIMGLCLASNTPRRMAEFVAISSIH